MRTAFSRWRHSSWLQRGFVHLSPSNVIGHSDPVSAGRSGSPSDWVTAAASAPPTALRLAADETPRVWYWFDPIDPDDARRITSRSIPRLADVPDVSRHLVVVVVDDNRLFPGDPVYARTSAEALTLLADVDSVGQLWLDHDLGETDDIMAVVDYLAERAFHGDPIPRATGVRALDEPHRRGQHHPRAGTLVPRVASPSACRVHGPTG